MSKKKIAIIGSGPAGLAAATICNQSNIDVMLFDCGKKHNERSHTTADDLGIGIGGAGLFSDGKFSFYPSGTHVYNLANKFHIKTSYDWLVNLLKRFDIDSCPLPNNDGSNKTYESGYLKEYLSTYGDLEQRTALIDQLATLKDCSLFTNTRIDHITKFKNQYLIDYYKSDVNKADRIIVDAVILATGRLGNIAIPGMISNIDFQYQKLRYEFGVRIETPSNVGFLSRLKNLDVKMIWKTLFGEVRTFCTCRNGEVWNIPYEKLSAISGRSDGHESGFSNFGLLLRFTGNAFENGEGFFNTILASEIIKKRFVIWQTLESFLSHKNGHSLKGSVKQFDRPWHPNDHFINQNISDILREDMYSSLKESLNMLLKWSPDLLDPKTVVLFPAIEGTGMYPLLNNNLQVNREKIWCCGDLAGKFRGIIPAFISGHYSGQCAMESL